MDDGLQNMDDGFFWKTLVDDGLVDDGFFVDDGLVDDGFGGRRFWWTMVLVDDGFGERWFASFKIIKNIKDFQESVHEFSKKSPAAGNSAGDYSLYFVPDRLSSHLKSTINRVSRFVYNPYM